MTTISASSTIGIVLGSPNVTNPVVINPEVTISNTGNGVYAQSGSWTILNAGMIDANATGVIVPAGTIISGGGVVLRSGGSVTNQSGATISGYYGIIGPVTVVNAGSIAGSQPHFGAGINLGAGGSVTNQPSASISGYNGIEAFSEVIVGGVETIVPSTIIRAWDEIAESRHERIRTGPYSQGSTP